MGQTIFSEHYQVCVGDDGRPRELTRTGDAATYKAVDLRSGEAAALTLLPVSAVPADLRAQFQARLAAAQQVDHINVAKLLAFGIEDDNFVILSEFLQGETIGRWVALRGPLPADAALQTALQVSSALSAARFQNLNHPAIQPSNIMIVPGQAVEGGWPYVKLMNFALAGIKLEAMPQFASPEQIKGTEVDFRSEIYSVGATMWFMLTGMIPGTRDRAAEARMLKQLPKPIRGLLSQMLQPDPAQRPQDPAHFTEQVHDCLARIDRRQAVNRKLGIPMVVPISTPAATVPRRRVPGKILALAALLVALAAAAAIWRPDKLLHQSNSGTENIGVPVGVPDQIAAQSAKTVAAPAISQPPQQALAENVPAPDQAQPVQSPPVEAAPASTVAAPPENIAQSQPVAPAPTAAPLLASASSVSNQNVQALEPTTTPAAGPASNATASETDAGPPPGSADAPPALEPAVTKPAPPKMASSITKAERPPKTVAAKRTGSSKTARNAERANDEDHDLPPLAVGSMRAKFVGTTPEGKWILALPNSETVVVPPPPIARRPRDSSHRRIRRALPVEDEAVPGEQIAEPDYVAPAVPNG